VNLPRTLLQILLPLVVLIGGALVAKAVAGKQPAPTVVADAVRTPLVRTATVTTTAVRLDVASQGTVEPLRTVDLSSQLAGRIVATSDALRAGGTFAADEVLLTIDPTDFELAIVQREADLARAELRLAQERAEADAALRAWQQIEGERPADALVRREPQIRDAEATVQAARAQLARSRLDLHRTQVKAPFAGRVQSVAADLGQTVQPGQRLAVLFDSAAVEVRLPIPVADAAFVDLPLGPNPSPGSVVTVQAEFAGSTHTWTGRVVRLESEVDRRTRQLVVVARIDGAAAQGDADKPPLLVGMFVRAVLHGRERADVLVAPLAALRAADTVWTVDDTDRLRRRPVQVLRREADRVLLTAGVFAGDRVSLSDDDAVTDGMQVRVQAAAAAGAAGGR
jgi:membrane fusion protein, multidrug efflux system